jgi:hypothetical protein
MPSSGGWENKQEYMAWVGFEQHKWLSNNVAAQVIE